MRILQVTPKFLPSIGGVETHVFELSKHLSLLGAEVKILTTNILSYRTMQKVYPSETEGVIRVRGFKVLPLPEGIGIVAPGMLKYLAYNYDIVHLHGYGSFPTFLAPFFRKAGKRVVITTHSDEGLPSLRKKIFDIIAPKFSIVHASRIIALSNHEKRVLERLGINRQKIVVVPNGIEPGLLNLSHSVSTGRKRVLYVGRINFRQKGLDIMLLALKRLVGKFRDLEFELVGPPEEIDLLMSYSRKLGLEKIVKYHGVVNREKLIHLMTHSDLLVLPSRFEPFGIVVLEAMAVGLPVVAASVGGIPEIVRNGVDGLLFPRGDMEALAAQIERVLTDSLLASKLASNAKERARSFTWPKIATHVMTVYKQLS